MAVAAGQEEEEEVPIRCSAEVLVVEQEQEDSVAEAVTQVVPEVEALANNIPVEEEDKLTIEAGLLDNTAEEEAEADTLVVVLEVVEEEGLVEEDNLGMEDSQDSDTFSN
jgi:hypothetical protein